MNNIINTLQSVFEYEFQDKALLKNALTHRSVKKTHKAHYERLEFLGDRVLGLVIAHMLLCHFSQDTEGQIAIRHTALVRQETLCRIARDIDLHTKIIGNFDADIPDSVLADVLESCIGAIFYDGGYDKVLPFVEKYFLPYIASESVVAKDPKSTLQEWSQKSKKGLPVYTLIERYGADHSPKFIMEVSVVGYENGCGQGTTKQQASQLAATDFIDKNGLLL